MAGNVLPEQNLEKQIGKQMGCMAGFLQIFDRHHILSGKRLYSTKRLPPAATLASEATMDREKVVETPPVITRELDKQPKGRVVSSPDRLKKSPVMSEIQSPVPEPATPTSNQGKASLPLPIFECKEGNARSPWKFKEAPRLSLDSRAVVDAKGSLKPREIRTNASILFANRCQSNREEYKADDSDMQRRSPSVIARLMGLEPLPDSNLEPDRKVELRRSASEARGRDLFQHRFVDGANFHSKQSQQTNFQNGGVSSNVVRENGAKQDRANLNRLESLRNAIQAPVRGTDRRKCFYNSADFFPERKQTASIYGEIEKRLKMRGIDEPAKDLETLKQILEALQLKGLLHTKKSPSQTNNRNFVYQYEQSPIVVIKPGRQPASPIRRIGKDSPPSSYRSRPGSRRNLNIDSPPTMSPRRDRTEIKRNVRNQVRGKALISPGRNECGVRSPNRRPQSVETQRRGNGNEDQRRVSPVQSPRVNVRRIGFDQTTNRLSGNRKATAEIYDKEEKVFIPAEDQTSTVSESSISRSSQADTEKSKVENHKEGKSFLERCDKLLHSIAEMAATTAELQPSPVSVLDSSFYKEESSPSPVMKRSIDFKDQFVESEDELWSPATLPLESKSEDKADDCDFAYISDILRAFNFLHDDSDVFLLLEKQQYVKGKDTSKVSRLQRKLIFDTINEILYRKKQLPPWKLISVTNSGSGETTLRQIWSEFQKIRERDTSDDLVEAICCVLRKDLAEDAFNGWEGCPVEMSESVLDIERLIFRDLIGETIQDLVALAGESNNNVPAPRRKLVF